MVSFDLIIFKILANEGINIILTLFQFFSCNSPNARISHQNFQNIFILKRTGEDSLADITKIIMTLIKQTFKNSTKVKRMKNYVLQLQFLTLFPDITKISKLHQLSPLWNMYDKFYTGNLLLPFSPTPLPCPSSSISSSPYGCNTNL